MSDDTSARDAAASELARRTTELRILQRVSTEVNRTLDLDEIYGIALRTMGELFEFHHAIILLLEADGRTLTVVASRGYENQAVGGKVAVGTGVIGKVAEKRRLLHVDNLGQQRAYAAAQRREMVKAGRGAEVGDAVPVPGLPNAESQIAIPLLIESELVGVFSIESPVRRTFGAHDLEIVTIVANQIASAIHNARLYDERRRAAQALQQANETLEARVAERTAALERELRVAQELLREARSRVEGPLLGDSDAVRRLRAAIPVQAARTDPLLLVGPPGAGEEEVARAIHADSGRRGAFILVHCAQVHSRDRSALFGSQRDAGGGGGGKLALAAGGTLFLDGIHDLPLDLQARLWDVLQGGTDVRLVAATTRDLAREAADGRFDPRLLEVLAVNRVAVPSLAERQDDIPVLVEHFVRRSARQLGKVIDGVEAASMQRLRAYTWPGNIRELGSVVERAVLVARRAELEIGEDLLDERQAVGSYRLVAPLGTGGMGEVWLAKHRLLARPAAVKLIRAEIGRGPDRDQLVRRFEREAQVTAGLRSPHTVELYDFGVNDSGSFYYVMELLRGLDLQRIVERFGPQPAERVVALLRQACRSLAEAHAHGLVHRDIKPANLFVTRLGVEYDYVKILDFGMVKSEPGEDATQISAGDAVQGTPAFMAPETVLGEASADGRSDLYSLACTAYWALTGVHVFTASTVAGVLLHHVRTPPVPPSQVTEMPVPAGLEGLLLRCLAKDPALRPASALGLDAELGRLTDLPEWTPERARAWWQTHAPDVVADDAPRAPQPAADPTEPDAGR
jgi:transcriptional regulator with GAF, ATPase, and Fis domain/serine/threonine protein kinase